MTPKSFAVVACRLLAIWYFVESTREFAAAVREGLQKIATPINTGPFLSVTASYPRPQDLWYLGVSPLIYFCAAVVLWLGASVLSDSMMRGMEANVSDSLKIGVKSWQALGFILIGLFLCAQGFSFLCGYIGSMVIVGSNVHYASNFDVTEVVAKIGASGIQFFIGWLLIFKTQMTSQLLNQ